MSNECIFCRILVGRANGHFVYRGRCCSAFLDKNPFTRGHTLIVPNEHAPRLVDLPTHIGAQIFKTAAVIANAIASSDLRSEGFNLRLSDGECAGQEVEHIHLHVIPRFPNDGVLIDLGRRFIDPAKFELAATEGEAVSSLHFTHGRRRLATP
jgi:histidine triad (HIT) family protein